VISLKLTDIEVTKLADTSLGKEYLYKDLFLDLTPDYTYNNSLNVKVPLRDVQALFDLESIKNSIRNCFLTSPGQKILNPTFGLDLRNYLFEPVSETTSFFIEDDIRNKLPTLEPRIKVTKVSVVPDIDQLLYNVTLQIDVPSLDIYGVQLKNVLNSEGYL
jgi:phage baseplate assembly protein W